MELMNDPVMVATGHTYDRVCIERWLQQGNRTCPVTGMRLRHLELTPNFALRNAIQVKLPSGLFLLSVHMQLHVFHYMAVSALHDLHTKDCFCCHVNPLFLCPTLN